MVSLTKPSQSDIRKRVSHDIWHRSSEPQTKRDAERRGLDGAPVFFLFNEKLLYSATRTGDMPSESRFHNLNQEEFGH